MSIFTHESMMNHHVPVFSRKSAKRCMSGANARSSGGSGHTARSDLHDVGLSWSDIVFEVEKPFCGLKKAARPAPPP